MRRLAREAAFRLIYAKLFDTADEELKIREYKEMGLNDAEAEFADSLYQTTLEHFDETISSISALSTGYDASRVYMTDKCALLLGMTEMKYFKDTPHIVAIDEAVNLSRIYSTENSQSFVNGILAAYKKQLEAENNG